MKNVVKIKGIILVLTICCVVCSLLGVGALMLKADATQPNQGGVFEIEGAQIKYKASDEDKNEIRFPFIMDETTYSNYVVENAVFGALVIPADLYSGDLTAQTVNVKNTELSEWVDYTSESNGPVKASIAFMNDIPAESYGRPIAVRGYVKVGTAYTYTDVIKASIYDVAKYNYDLAETTEPQKKLLETYLNYEYTITFDLADGEGVAEPQSLKYGEKVTEPTGITKDGYILSGFKAGSKLWDFETAIKGSMTLTASYVLNKVIYDFDVQGLPKDEKDIVLYELNNNMPNFGVGEVANVTDLATNLAPIGFALDTASSICENTVVLGEPITFKLVYVESYVTRNLLTENTMHGKQNSIMTYVGTGTAGVDFNNYGWVDDGAKVAFYDQVEYVRLKSDFILSAYSKGFKKIAIEYNVLAKVSNGSMTIVPCYTTDGISYTALKNTFSSVSAVTNGLSGSFDLDQDVIGALKNGGYVVLKIDMPEHTIGKWNSYTVQFTSVVMSKIKLDLEEGGNSSKNLLTQTNASTVLSFLNKGDGYQKAVVSYGWDTGAKYAVYYTNYLKISLEDIADYYDLGLNKLTLTYDIYGKQVPTTSALLVKAYYTVDGNTFTEIEGSTFSDMPNATATGIAGTITLNDDIIYAILDGGYIVIRFEVGAAASVNHYYQLRFTSIVLNKEETQPPEEEPENTENLLTESNASSVLSFLNNGQMAAARYAWDTGARYAVYYTNYLKIDVANIVNYYEAGFNKLTLTYDIYEVQAPSTLLVKAYYTVDGNTFTEIKGSTFSDMPNATATGIAGTITLNDDIIYAILDGGYIVIRFEVGAAASVNHYYKLRFTSLVLEKESRLAELDLEDGGNSSKNLLTESNASSVLTFLNNGSKNAFVYGWGENGAKYAVYYTNYLKIKLDDIPTYYEAGFNKLTLVYDIYGQWAPSVLAVSAYYTKNGVDFIEIKSNTFNDMPNKTANGVSGTITLNKAIIDAIKCGGYIAIKFEVLNASDANHNYQLRFTDILLSQVDYESNKIIPGVDMSSTEIVVVGENKTEYAIVYSENATEAEQFAAKELSDFIEQSTGVKLNVISDKKAVNNFNNRYFSIGKTTLLAYAKENLLYSCDYSALNGDGFVIKTIQNVIIMDADNDRGVLYAVYDFLEKFCGVEFIATDCTYVPTMQEIKIRQMEIIEVPDIAIRNYLSSDVITDTLFATRLRYVSEYGDNEAKYGYGFLQDFYSEDPHNFFDLVPKAEYYESHPEWFGKDNDSSELCLTNGIKDKKLDTSKNESVAKTVIEKLKVWMTEKPNAKYFYVCQEDNGSSCLCNNCIISNYSNGGEGGTLMIFLNVIADELQKWVDETYPGREFYLVTFAYQYTLEPPTKKSKGEIVPYNDSVVARDNIIVRLAPIEQCYYHAFDDENCERNKSINDYINGWLKITDKLFIWDYSSNYTEYLWYYPNLYTIADDLQLYNENGVIYVMTQGGHRESELYQDKLKAYVSSKLMWNLDNNVTTLISEFNKYYFGAKVGSVVDEFISYAETYYEVLNATLDGKFHTHTYKGLNFLDSTYYSKEFLEELIAILDRANEVLQKDDSLSGAEKKIISNRLLELYIIPQRMILRNYTDYYSDSTKTIFAIKFYDNCEKLGIQYLGESYTLSKFKTDFGI